MDKLNQIIPFCAIVLLSACNSSSIVDEGPTSASAASKNFDYDVNAFFSALAVGDLATLNKYHSLGKGSSVAIQAQVDNVKRLGSDLEWRVTETKFIENERYVIVSYYSKNTGQMLLEQKHRFVQVDRRWLWYGN